MAWRNHCNKSLLYNRLRQVSPSLVDKHEGLMATRTDSANNDQFSISYFVNKETPVLSKTAKMIIPNSGNNYGEGARINCPPDNISHHNGIFSSVHASAPCKK